MNQSIAEKAMESQCYRAEDPLTQPPPPSTTATSSSLSWLRPDSMANTSLPVDAPCTVDRPNRAHHDPTSTTAAHQNFCTPAAKSGGPHLQQHQQPQQLQHTKQMNEKSSLLFKMEQVATVWLLRLVQLPRHNDPDIELCITSLRALLSEGGFKGYGGAPTAQMHQRRFPSFHDLPGMVFTLRHMYTCLLSEYQMELALAQVAQNRHHRRPQDGASSLAMGTLPVDATVATAESDSTMWEAKARQWLNVDSAESSVIACSGTTFHRYASITPNMATTGGSSMAVRTSPKGGTSTPGAGQAEYMGSWMRQLSTKRVLAPMFSPIQKASRSNRSVLPGPAVTATAEEMHHEGAESLRPAPPECHADPTDTNDDGESEESRMPSPTDVTAMHAALYPNKKIATYTPNYNDEQEGGLILDAEKKGYASDAMIETWMAAETSPEAANGLDACLQQQQQQQQQQRQATVSMDGTLDSKQKHVHIVKNYAPTMNDGGSNALAGPHQDFYQKQMTAWILALFHAAKCPHTSRGSHDNDICLLYENCAHYKRVWAHLSQDVPSCATAATVNQTAGMALSVWWLDVNTEAADEACCPWFGSQCRWAHEAVSHYSRCKMMSCGICGPVMRIYLPSIKQDLLQASQAATSKAKRPPVATLSPENKTAANLDEQHVLPAVEQAVLQAAQEVTVDGTALAQPPSSTEVTPLPTVQTYLSSAETSPAKTSAQPESKDAASNSRGTPKNKTDPRNKLGAQSRSAPSVCARQVTRNLASMKPRKIRHHSLGSGEVTCRHSQPSSKQTNLLHLLQEVAVASRAFSLL
jgi:hypothetical protein